MLENRVRAGPERRQRRRAFPLPPAPRSLPRRRWDAARSPAGRTDTRVASFAGMLRASSVARMRTSESSSPSSAVMNGEIASGRACSASMAAARSAGVLRAQIGQQRPDARFVADAHERGHDRFAHARHLFASSAAASAGTASPCRPARAQRSSALRRPDCAMRRRGDAIIRVAVVVPRVAGCVALNERHRLPPIR